MDSKKTSKIRLLLDGICLVSISWLGYQNVWLGYQNVQLSNAVQSCPKLPFTFETRINGMVYRGDSTKLLDASLLIGGYDMELEFLSQAAVARKLEDTTFLDVGAYKGLYSTQLASRFSKVLAFEPNPDLMNWLTTNIKENRLNNVEIIPIGLGNVDGSLLFRMPPNWHDATGAFSSSMWNDPDAETLEIRVRPGDDILKELNVKRVGAVKVDVEGFEKPVLQGLSDTIEGFRPLVVLELNMKNDEGFRDFADLQSTLPQGYTFFQVAGSSKRLSL